MALNEIYELKHIQNLLGQEIMNVYHFRQTAHSISVQGAEQLTQSFVNQWVTAINDLQSQDCENDRVVVQCLNDFSDYYEAQIFAGGTRVFPAMPPQNSFAFKFVRPYPPLRHGWKRISGLANGTYEAGILQPWFLAKVDIVKDKFENELYNFPNDRFEMIVYRRDLSVLPSVPWWPVTIVIPSNKIGTQNTRKV